MNDNRMKRLPAVFVVHDDAAVLDSLSGLFDVRVSYSGRLLSTLCLHGPAVQCRLA